MCGIWAIFGAKKDVKQLCIQCMKVSHRGPDAFRIESIPAFPRSCLGFHRLTILDPTFGMQPMAVTTYPHLRLLYNGEIYNCRDLGRQYDFKYQTHCDGEVILHLYARFGAEVTAEMLDGVFAFCIVDTRARKVHLGRDIFGVRPLFTFLDTGTLGICSEAKGLTSLTQAKVKPFRPGYLQTYDITSEGQAVMVENKHFLEIGGSDFTSVCPVHPTDIQANIRLLLKEAVKKRLMSERRIGCLLSGGLDSSLVTALLVQCLTEVGCDYKVQTFSIGLEDSTDLKAARTLAKYLGTEHHEVRFTPDEGFAAIHEAILSIESFETIVIRGSVAMYLVCKYIKEKTDTTVVFSGEGSDEVCQGYIYFHKAPTAADADAESRRILHDLYLYDNLRADRTTAAHGLELRLPFLDKFFTSYYLSLPPEKRQPQDGVEKHLLRSAFANTGLLPDEILWRPKEGFSDGVSSKKQSWFRLLQDHIEDKISDEALAAASERFDRPTPKTKEAYYYRQIFEELFPGCDHLIPYYWMPKWINATDPSARVLSHYK